MTLGAQSPGIALRRGNTDGVGNGQEIPIGCSVFTVQTLVTGTALTAISAKLQGSLDNVNWYDLTTSTAVAGDTQHVADRTAKWVRGSFTGITGGAADTVITLQYAAA